jgi:hypothetical protein
MRPLTATSSAKEEDARHFALRIERAVAVLADEAESNWWVAQQRAATSATPDFRGPEIAPWRRAWVLPERRRRRERPGRSTPW